MLIAYPAAASGKIKADCIYNGVPHGKVKVVNSFEDFKIRAVTSFEDISVKKVSSLPFSCGEWQFVDSFEDFTVKFTDSFSKDLIIKKQTRNLGLICP